MGDPAHGSAELITDKNLPDERSTDLPMTSVPRSLSSMASAVLLAATMTPSASAQLAGGVIDELEGVTVEQHLEAQLPLTAEFFAHTGDGQTLAQSFGAVPVILTLNYVDCPQLCSLQLTQLSETLASIDLELGTDYRVVTVSIDPNDSPERTTPMQSRYVGEYLDISEKLGKTRDVEAAKAGWTILSGSKGEIDRVAVTVGFGYRWVESNQEYAHQATNILCSPEGIVSRYLPGVSVDMAATLRLSLVDAAEGKIGSLYDQIFLNCFIYDPNTGQYSLAAWRLLKVAAALTALAVATGIFFMKRGEAQQIQSGDATDLAASANEESQRS